MFTCYANDLRTSVWSSDQLKWRVQTECDVTLINNMQKLYTLSLSNDMEEKWCEMQLGFYKIIWDVFLNRSLWAICMFYSKCLHFTSELSVIICRFGSLHVFISFISKNPNQDEVLEWLKQMKHILIIKCVNWKTLFKLLLTQWAIFTWKGLMLNSVCVSV